MDQNESALRKSFESYLAKAREVLTWDFSGDEIYKIIGPPSRLKQLYRLVTDLHGSDEYASLVRSSAEYFKPLGHRQSISVWHYAISQFFSEKGVYELLSDSRKTVGPGLFDTFQHHFKREFEIVTVLVPLHGIRFPFASFESREFSIQRFSAEQMSAYLAPRYQLLEHDFESILSFISGYSYLVFRIRENLHGTGIIYREPDHELPERGIELLQSLALLEPKDPFGRDAIDMALDSVPGSGSYPPLFRTPFVLRIRNNRAQAPANLIGLIHRFYEEEEIEEYHDPEGNVEDIGPPSPVYFAPGDSDHVKECLGLHDLIQRIGKSTNIEGTFLIRALHYLYRGATALDKSEALLWNVMCLESLFGIEGITSRSIARGLRHVYGTDPTKASKVVSYFKRGKDSPETTGLYDLRSRLLHGDVLPGDLSSRHVILSRLVARDSVEWALKFLINVDALLEKATESRRFTRDHFLAVLHIPQEEVVMHKLISEALL